MALLCRQRDSKAFEEKVSVSSELGCCAREEVGEGRSQPVTCIPTAATGLVLHPTGTVIVVSWTSKSPTQRQLLRQTENRLGPADPKLEAGKAMFPTQRQLTQ